MYLVNIVLASKLYYGDKILHIKTWGTILAGALVVVGRSPFFLQHSNDDCLLTEHSFPRGLPSSQEAEACYLRIDVLSHNVAPPIHHMISAQLANLYFGFSWRKRQLTAISLFHQYRTYLQ